MTERSIILSGDNVQLAYDGLKTATRRLMNPQPEFLQCYKYKGRTVYDSSLRSWCWKGEAHGRHPDEWGPSLAARCPYGQPGDLLYVRETMWRNGGFVATDPQSFPNEGKVPSIHMPKWASRLWLEITSVKAERLQDISADDARAEGIWIKSVGPASDLAAQNQFALLWNQIHKKAAKAAGVDYAWDLNPWVWAIGFKRTEKKHEEAKIQDLRAL